MTDTASFSFTVGALLRGPVRRYLQRQAFHDTSVKWLETKTLLASRFDIKASPSAIQSMGATIQAWAAQLEHVQ